MSKKAMINDIEISVVGTEEITESSDVTDKKVEDGSPMTDHISHNPLQLSFTALFVGDNAFQQLQKIRSLRDNKEIVSFTGRNIVTGLVITNISRRHSKEIFNGMEFDISMEQVRLGRYSTVNINLSKIKVKPKPKTSKKPTSKKQSKMKSRNKKQKAKKTKVTKKTNKGRVQKKKRPPGPKLTHNFINPMRPGPIMKESSPYY